MLLLIVYQGVLSNVHAWLCNRDIEQLGIFMPLDYYDLCLIYY